MIVKLSVIFGNLRLKLYCRWWRASSCSASWTRSAPGCPWAAASCCTSSTPPSSWSPTPSTHTRTTGAQADILLIFRIGAKNIYILDKLFLAPNCPSPRCVLVSRLQEAQSLLAEAARILSYESPASEYGHLQVEVKQRLNESPLLLPSPG